MTASRWFGRARRTLGLAIDLDVEEHLSHIEAGWGTWIAGLWLLPKPRKRARAAGAPAGSRPSPGPTVLL